MLSFLQLTEHIVKAGGKFRLVSRTAGKNLGTYNSKAGAEKREQQISFFKHQNETANSFDSSHYNDGDEGLQGQIFKRAYVDTPLSPVAEVSTYAETVSSSETRDPGMYSYFSLTPVCAKKLYTWCHAAGIPNPVKPEDMHSTCLYTPKSVNFYTPYDQAFGVDPNTYSFALLGTALVLKFEHSIPRKQWDFAKDHGAEFTYPTYTPHITLSYDPGDFDWSQLLTPTIPIIFEREYLQSLDKDELTKESVNDKFKELVDRAKETCRRWVKKGEDREQMTKYAKMAINRGPLEKFHPGYDMVHRGESENSMSYKDVGTSWSKDPKVAKEYADKSKEDSVVVKKKIIPNVPALDINKILNKMLPDKEVFVAK